MRFFFFFFYGWGGGGGVGGSREVWLSFLDRVQWLNRNRTQSELPFHLYHCLFKSLPSSIWKVPYLNKAQWHAEFRIDWSFGETIWNKWKLCLLSPLQTILGLSTSRVWMKLFQNPSAPYMEPNISETYYRPVHQSELILTTWLCWPVTRC